MLALTWVTGCVASPPFAREVAGHAPPRRPDGVFVVPEPARPAGTDRAVAGGVVTLFAPPSREEVVGLVRAYVRAFVSTDATAFAPLLAQGARRLEEDAGVDLEQSLVRRVRANDYSRLKIGTVVAYEDIRVSTREDAPRRFSIADGAREGDLLVEVPVRAPRVSGVRLFGPMISLLVRRGGDTGGLQIAGVAEEDAPWQ